MRILDFRAGKMTKRGLDLGDVGDVLSVVGPGALFGIGGAGLGSIIDMLAGTKRLWTTILGLTGLAGGVGLGSTGLFKSWFAAERGPEFPKKLSDIPAYAKIFRYIVFMRADPSAFKGSDHPIFRRLPEMDGEQLYCHLTQLGIAPNTLPGYRANPYVHNVAANLVSPTDPRQFAILHAAHFNLEVVPLQLCWNELDANQRNRLFSSLGAYREKLALNANDPTISKEADNEFNKLVKQLIEYGKKEHADALRILHQQHQMDVQEFAQQIQQVKQRP